MQYEELIRACEGNKCIIPIKRPTPTMQPRFERLYVCLDGCKKAF